MPYQLLDRIVGVRLEVDLTFTMRRVVRGIVGVSRNGTILILLMTFRRYYKLQAIYRQQRSEFNGERCTGQRERIEWMIGKGEETFRVGAEGRGITSGSIERWLT